MRCGGLVCIFVFADFTAVSTYTLRAQSKGDGIFWLWVVINGCFVMAVPVLLITAAMRHILPPENALIGLLELLLAPIWVFLALGEAPSVWTFVGGILLLITLAWHEYVRTVVLSTFSHSLLTFLFCPIHPLPCFHHACIDSNSTYSLPTTAAFPRSL